MKFDGLCISSNISKLGQFLVARVRRICLSGNNPESILDRIMSTLN